MLNHFLEGIMKTQCILRIVQTLHLYQVLQMTCGFHGYHITLTETCVVKTQQLKYHYTYL